MKKMILIAVAALFAVTTMAAVAQARPTKRLDGKTQMCRLIAQGRLGWESEPWGAGGKGFKKVCKNCHFKDNEKGATFLHAESYTSKGWNSIFTSRRVECARVGSWDSLSEEEIQFVADYLYRNAAWTYDPNSADSC